MLLILCVMLFYYNVINVGQNTKEFWKLLKQYNYLQFTKITKNDVQLNLKCQALSCALY